MGRKLLAAAIAGSTLAAGVACGTSGEVEGSPPPTTTLANVLPSPTTTSTEVVVSSSGEALVPTAEPACTYTFIGGVLLGQYQIGEYAARKASLVKLINDGITANGATTPDSAILAVWSEPGVWPSTMGQMLSGLGEEMIRTANPDIVAWTQTVSPEVPPGGLVVAGYTVNGDGCENTSPPDSALPPSKFWLTPDGTVAD